MKIKKRQLQTSFYLKFIDNIFRDIFVFQISFVFVKNIESNEFYFNNININNQFNNQQIIKQNINNFTNFTSILININMINN